MIVSGCSKESPVGPDLTGSDAGKSLAKQTRYAVTFQGDEGVAYIVDQGTQWVDEKGILHIRNQVRKDGPLTGQLEGYDRHNVFNADIDLATMSGPFVGTFVMEVEWTERGLKGTFSGGYKGYITNGNLAGTTSGLGEGDFAGMVLRCDQKESSPGSLNLIFTGTITDHN
ncbi:MAG: hypothetical protein ONB32_15160 [candidate division KSB1 bacterium]|nr:hypothetical protein [candidate division KSB1 bacterium]